MHDPNSPPPSPPPSPTVSPAHSPNESPPEPAPRPETPPVAPPPPSDAPPELQRALRSVGAIRAQIRRAVVGQDEAVDHVVAALLAGGHVLLEGAPGVGKTLLALSLARTFGGTFRRVQFTPDLMPSDVTGHSIYNPETGEFHLRKGPAFTNLLLADEINRAPAKTQAALLEVMQEQQISIEGTSHRLPAPFLTLATLNPIEHEGTYPLPEAQLDRFLLKVLVPYPEDAATESAIVLRVTAGRTGDALDVDDVARVIEPRDVLELQRITAGITVDERIVDYAVRIVRRTREWGGLRLGTGPRGGIALVRTARSLALLAGRDYAIPDDVKRAALPVLRHRVTISADLEIAGQTPDRVLLQILEDVEAPRK